MSDIMLYLHLLFDEYPEIIDKSNCLIDDRM